MRRASVVVSNKVSCVCKIIEYYSCIIIVHYGDISNILYANEHVEYIHCIIIE